MLERMPAGPELIERASEHFLSEEFQGELDNFVAAHCRAFAAVADTMLEASGGDSTATAEEQHGERILMGIGDATSSFKSCSSRSWMHSSARRV